MEYKLPELPEPGTLFEFKTTKKRGPFKFYAEEQMRQYAGEAVAPLLAEIERLEDLLFERGESGDIDVPE